MQLEDEVLAIVLAPQTSSDSPKFPNIPNVHQTGIDTALVSLEVLNNDINGECHHVPGDTVPFPD